MTSMIIGLPDRYRPLDEVGPVEHTPTGVIRCWRAQDRVLNRDVAIRVHTPGGPAAHAWIARALTAGGLATPALAMVYDAAEGGAGDVGQETPAYVVNEWIEGETLADRLARGPVPEREARTVLRRLADGVAEAHRAGLAVGGLTADRVVLRPNGLVGVRAVPAATASVPGDITALGELLEACLTGHPGGGGRIAQPDLAALVRRARSTEPGESLSSAAAMAAALADRPRSRTVAPEPTRGEEPAGWLRKLRERSADGDGGTAPRTRVRDDSAVPFQATNPPVGPAPTRTLPAAQPAAAVVPPPAAPAPPPAPAAPPPAAAYLDDDELMASRIFGGTEPSIGLDALDLRPGHDEEALDYGVAADDEMVEEQETHDRSAQERHRRRLLAVGLPLLALAVVMGVAWWLGSNVLSVAGSVDQSHSAPPASVSASASSAAPAGQPVPIKSASVFDPFGDGQPENNDQVPLSFDGKPATAWKTLQYRSAALGNLKPGVGVVYDLGSPQALSGVTITSTIPGATMEVRAGDQPRGSLDNFQVVGSATVTGSTDIRFTKPVTTRYVLIWITKLPAVPEGFQADVAELVVHAAR